MERYASQAIIKDWDQKAVKDASVLVVGAGTTGNEVLKNLALVGIGHLSIVDFDKIETVNLNRSVLFRDADVDQPKATVAANRLHELNPGITVEAISCDVIHDFGCLRYGEFKCVILTVDNLEARMWVNRYCRRARVPLVDTGVDGLVGNVFVMATPFDVCVECGWSSREYARLTERYSCLKLGVDHEERRIPMVITTAATIGGVAAEACLAVLHAPGSEINRAGRVFQYDGEASVSLNWSVPINPDCPAHLEPFDSSEVLLDVELDASVEEIEDRIASSRGAVSVEIWHDKPIVYAVTCGQGCSNRQPIDPVPLGRFARRMCSECSRLSLIPDLTSEQLSGQFTLRSLGIPQKHLLRVLYEVGESVHSGWIQTTG